MTLGGAITAIKIAALLAPAALGLILWLFAEEADTLGSSADAMRGDR